MSILRLHNEFPRLHKTPQDLYISYENIIVDLTNKKLAIVVTMTLVAILTVVPSSSSWWRLSSYQEANAVTVTITSVTGTGFGVFKCPGASSSFRSSTIAFGASNTGGGSFSIAGGSTITGILQRVSGTFTPTSSGPVGTYTAYGIEQINLCPGAGPFTNVPITISGQCGTGSIKYVGPNGETGQYTGNSICR